MTKAVDRSLFAVDDPGRSTFRKVRRAIAFAAVALGFSFVTASAWPIDGPIGETSIALGFALTAIALAGRLWVSLYQAGHKNKRLITVGPYSLCRNPMYLCNFVGGFGACLATVTLTAPVVFALAWAVHYRRVIRDEEARLRRHHGVAFDAYRAMTPKLVPSLRGFHQPVEYLIRPRELAARIPLAMLPMAGLAVLRAFAELHARGQLPELIRIL